MENLPLISVIVPVYKVDAYLDKCISSIVNQTYKNLEIILVDDGSPDKCGAMCDAWAQRDNRIRVIHQKNQGSGAARNAALDVARGELIAFVDSDDYLVPDMYTYLYGLLEQGADIAECDYTEVTDDDAVFSNASEVRTYSAQEAMTAHIQDRFFRQLIWNKLYRHAVIGDVRFPRDKKIDDEFFTYRVLGNARTLIRSNRICYAYRQQEHSIMHSMDVQKRFQAVEAKVERQKYITAQFPALTADSLKNLWFTCLYQGQMALRKETPEEISRTMAYLKDILAAHPIRNTSCSFKERLWLTMAAVSFRATCHIRNRLKIGL